MNPFMGFILLHLLFSFNVECNIEQKIRESITLNQYIKINLTETQAALYKRIKATQFLINPYVNLLSNQTCTGTSHGMGSGKHDYHKWRVIYKNCVYLDGNLEINNFDPYNLNTFSREKLESDSQDQSIDETYDFSFLDDIKEITGYLIISGTRIKSLRLKNLEIIRGKQLFREKFSVYIESNIRLEKLDMTKLKEIQRGDVLINTNPKLCHMNEVNWSDILGNENSLGFIKNNADPSTCPKCESTCCMQKNENNSTECNGGCWYPNGCQTLNKVVCHQKCGDGRCFGRGPFDCCDKECAGGCYGPTKKDCVVCKNLRIYASGECVETCPRIQVSDPLKREVVLNPNGLYQYGITCIKSCPAKSFVYNELCLAKCPPQTYQDEELIVNSETGEKGEHRVCRPCTAEKCPKVCSIKKLDKKEELSVKHLKMLEGCEVLNSDLLILQPIQEESNKNLNSTELTEADLEVLKSIKIINGFVRIQSNKFKSLNFLRNLEIIRANTLVHDKYSMIITSKSLKTLGLNKLRSIENGEVHLKAESLCLHDTINWDLMLSTKNALTYNKLNNEGKNCESEGFVCHPACKGCWSTGPTSCQFCKTYKLDDRCVEFCSGQQKSNNNQLQYIYLSNNETRECNYCHVECKNGCSGPSEHDCFECQNYKLKLNETSFKCVEKCPLLHYSDQDRKECLPCYEHCYECTGPKKSIGPGGCTKCSNALVENDYGYSIIKCIASENYTCGDNFFIDVVPENLKTHPLKGKRVCRKCNDECLNCFDNGVKLNMQCEQCRNYYSESHLECVSNCSMQRNEYLLENTNICKSCSVECKSEKGCFGGGVNQCNECRAYKLVYKDAARLVEYLLTLKSKQSELNTQLNDSLKSQLDFYKEMIKNFIEYKNSQEFNFSERMAEINEENMVFCVSECPTLMPYKTGNLYCTDSRKSMTLPYILPLIAAILISLVLFIFLFSYFKLKDKKNRIRAESEKKFFSNQNDDDEKKDDYNNDDCSTKLNNSNLRLIQKDELSLRVELGKGAFGTVFEGFYIPNGQHDKKIKVAIKVLNKCRALDEKSLSDQTNELLDEATLMASVNHKYCLQLSALCLAEPVMMITQLMPFGSALVFLQKNKNILIKKERTEKMLLEWSHQIAEGMNYLESLGIVHRDLAARNILIKNYDHIKITDFGLARIIEPSEDGFYATASNSLVPVKWLAIECIKQRLFNHKSDVWSYAVCLWEIFTFCAKPYAEIEPTEIVSSIIKGVRLSKPQMVSTDIYLLMLKCWLENPMARPNFAKLSEDFAKMSLEPKRYLSMKQVNFDEKFITINENTDELLDELTSLADSTSLSNEKRVNRKNSCNNNSNNILSDEGIDMNSFDIGSSIGDASNTLNAQSLIFNRTSNLTDFNDLNDSSENVITFKRSNTFSKVPRVINEEALDDSSLIDYLTQTNLEEINTREKHNNQQQQKVSSQLNKPIKSNNLKNLKKYLFHRSSSAREPQRLNSQMSTGTTSTYLSSTMSSSSEGLPSPGLPTTIKNLNNKSSIVKRNSSNVYDDEVDLDRQNLIPSKSSSLSPSSLTPSRSNSNSSTNSYDFNKHEVFLLNKRDSNTNSNTDYLEPVTHNIRQNFEYFNDSNAAIRQVPSIIIMSDTQKRNQSIYYNDEVLSSLINTTHNNK